MPGTATPEQSGVKTVYLVRHGESTDNTLPVFQSVQCGLSDAGRQQSEQLAQKIHTLACDVLVTSPMPRAEQTAALIAYTTGLHLTSSQLFVEPSKPPVLDGKAWEDAAAQKVYRRWERELYTSGVHTTDGECYDNIVQRADRALDMLSGLAGRRICVVSHGRFIRALVMRHMLGEAMSGPRLHQFQESKPIDNASWVTLELR